MVERIKKRGKERREGRKEYTSTLYFFIATMIFNACSHEFLLLTSGSPKYLP
jgi:hypothetical protein